MAGTGWSPIRMDERDYDEDISDMVESIFGDSLSPILERPTKRHAAAMPVVVSDYPIVGVYNADWVEVMNQDVSLEKSSSRASSADPALVAAAQAKLDEALIEEAEAKLQLAKLKANKAKHEIEFVVTKSASKSSTRSRSAYGPAPVLDGKSNDNTSQITALRDIRDDLSDLVGLGISGMGVTPEGNPQVTGAEKF